MKNIVRSLFISFFPFAAVVFLIYGITQCITNGFSWPISGLLIIASTIVVFFAGLFIKPRARTTANLIWHSSSITVGLCSSLLAIFLVENFNIALLLESLFLSVGWLLYIKWFSVFKDRENKTLKEGSQLPEFQLENSEKQTITSTSFLGNSSIFLFYRGNWCPLCMAQIKEITEQYKTLDKLGVCTVFISPQPHTQTKNLADKFDLNLHFLVDYKNKVAKQLGIFVKNGIPAGFQLLGYDSDTVLPTVIITDKKGAIIFTDLTDNYRVRPEPEVFIKIIKESIAT